MHVLLDESLFALSSIPRRALLVHSQTFTLQTIKITKLRNISGCSFPIDALISIVKIAIGTIYRTKVICNDAVVS